MPNSTKKHYRFKIPYTQYEFVTFNCIRQTKSRCTKHIYCTSQILKLTYNIQSGHSDFSKIQYIYRFSKKNIVPIQYIICLKYSTIQYILNISNKLLLQYIKLLKIYVAPQLMHFLIYTSIHLLLCIPILCLYLFLTDYASVYAYVYLSIPLFSLYMYI